MMRKVTAVVVLIIVALVSLKIVFNNLFRNDAALREDAERKFEIFQESYNKSMLEDIFEKTCSDFKKATSEAEFLAIMNGKKEIFGQFKKAELLHSNVINSKLVELSYRSIYAHYSLIEEYTYNKISNSEMCLKIFYIDDSGKHGKVIKL